ncbi:MAG: SRPBCC domain-containing protein [Reichenbachiella sp.]
MTKIQTNVHIEASVEVVWMAFMDFASYSEWNDFMKIEGDIEVGNKVNIEINLNGKVSKFKPKILVLEDERKLEWRGSLGHKRVFSGRHYFHFEPQGEGQTLFTHGEDFSGVFKKAIFKKIGKATKSGFENFNESLKVHAEDLVI